MLRRPVRYFLDRSFAFLLLIGITLQLLTAQKIAGRTKQNMIYRSSLCVSGRRLLQLLARCRQYPSIYRVNCESDRRKHNEWRPYRITGSRQELLMRVAAAVRVLRTTLGAVVRRSALVFVAARRRCRQFPSPRT